MRRNRVIYNIKFIPNIEGWENYHISRRGRLYRYYPNRRVWMILNGTISRGRVYHILRNGTSRIRIQASRLVAIAYISNPDNKPFVYHKDNNPLNNRVENLYWGTQLENIRQCISDKRLRPQGKIPLTKSQIKSLNQDYTSGVKVRLIGATPDLREFDPNTGRSIRWGGWEMYLSEFQLKKEEELINLRYDLIQTFEIFVRGCKDIEKLKRLTKRYSKYNENNQSI